VGGILGNPPALALGVGISWNGGGKGVQKHGFEAERAGRGVSG
jgi:hypothetical protein